MVRILMLCCSPYAAYVCLVEKFLLARDFSREVLCAILTVIFGVAIV